MVSNPRSCVPLIRFANDLKKSGLFIIGHVKLEDIDEYEIDPILKESPLWLKLLDSLNVKAFFELTLARTVREGFHHLVRIAGLGAMKPNTIFFGFYDDQVQKNSLEFEQMKIRSPDEYEFPPIRLIDGNKNMSPKEYMMLLSDAMHKFQKNVCIGRHFNSFFRVSFLNKICLPFPNVSRFLYRIKFQQSKTNVSIFGQLIFLISMKNYRVTLGNLCYN